jgi:hypothetical protein
LGQSDTEYNRVRNPPIEWSDLVSLGMSPGASFSTDGETISVDPPPPKIVAAALRSAAVTPLPDRDSERLAYIKALRDILLAETDWTQISASLPQVQAEAWAAWRAIVIGVPDADQGSGPIAWPAPPVVTPAAVPKSAPVWCLLTWLRMNHEKTLSDFVSAVDSIQDEATREQARLDLFFAADFYRDDTLLIAIGQAWGVDLDQAFREAVEIARVR